MKSLRVIRKVDELGRIVLPADMRNRMGIKTGSELQIEYLNDEITLSIPEDTCMLCGTTKDLVAIDEDSFICKDCAGKIKTATK